MAGLKANTFGVEKLSISLLHKDGPILKNITNITALDNLNEDLNKLNIDQNETLIIGSKNIFIFKNNP